MVVVDIERTLVRSDDSISDYTIGVFNSLRKKDIVVVVLTTRPVRSLMRCYPFLPCDFSIFNNGAEVMEKGKLLFSAGINGAYEFITRILTRENYNIAVEADNRLYANFDALRLWPKTHYVRTEDFHEVRGLSADKLIIETNTIDNIARLRRFIPEDCYLLLAENTTALIVNRRASRLEAVRIVAEKLGISLQDVAVFGSDCYDLALMALCGSSIAVENGSECIKSQATDICGSGDDDGVAKWLEAHI